MFKRIFAAVLLAAISATFFACQSGQNSTSSSVTSSTPASSAVSSAPSSSASSLPSGATSSAPASSAAASKAPAKTNGKTTSKPAKPAKPSKNDLYKETEKSFSFNDGIYKRIYGNRAVFVVMKDVSSMKDGERNTLAKTTAGSYLKNDYYCTVIFVKPNNNGKLDLTKTTSDNRTALVYDLHSDDMETITINVHENPLQEYIDKQFKKAKVNK